MRSFEGRRMIIQERKWEDSRQQMSSWEVQDEAGASLKACLLPLGNSSRGKDSLRYWGGHRRVT